MQSLRADWDYWDWEESQQRATVVSEWGKEGCLSYLLPCCHIEDIHCCTLPLPTAGTLVSTEL